MRIHLQIFTLIVILLDHYTEAAMYYFNRQTNVCPNGFFTSSSSITLYSYKAYYCQPDCSPKCSNGDCIAPNYCACAEGYIRTAQSNSCKPYCESECLFGTCISPNQCECLNGYALDKQLGKCLPVCADTWINGYCAAPNKSECYNGYSFDNNHRICLPVCTDACVNSVCVAPNTCKCHDNYTGHPNNHNICEPKCQPNCVNSTCTGPNQCSCFEDFKEVTNHPNECTPICNKCTNGVCVSPNICECNFGYTWDVKSEDCKPVCEEDCVNGECIAPNNCRCYTGYKKSDSYTHICESYSECAIYNCSLPCEGSDLIDESSDPTVNRTLCVCNDGFAFNNITNRCDPVCQKPCVNAMCAAPNLCMCGNTFYNSTFTNNSVLCELKPCKEAIYIDGQYKIKTTASENNTKCLQLNGWLKSLETFTENCYEFTNVSCYDMLCIQDHSLVCSMVYTCRITDEFLNTSVLEDSFCSWRQRESIYSFSENLTKRQENVVHKYIHRSPCLLCLCPLNIDRIELCLDEEVSFTLCACPKKETLIKHTSAYVKHNEYNIIYVLLIIVITIVTVNFGYFLKHYYFKQKHSAEYVVEAHFNDTYGTDIVEGKSNEIMKPDESLYEEIKDTDE